MGSQSWTRLSDFDFISLLYSPALAVRVTNRFKRLDQVYLKNYGRRSIILYRRQRIKPSQRKKQEGKWFSEETLQIAEERREAKGKGKRERHNHLNAEFQRIPRRDKKAFLSGQCKEIEENNRMRKFQITMMMWSLI